MACRWRHLMLGAGALAMAGFLAVAANAQPPGGGPGGPGGPGGGFGRGGGRGGFGMMGMGGQQSLVALAANEAVQKDLGVKEDQVAKLSDLAEEEREARMGAMRDTGFDFQALRDLEPAERQAKMEEFGKKMQEVGKTIDAKFEPKLAEVLEPTQVDRLRQISWQAAGVRAAFIE